MDREPRAERDRIDAGIPDGSVDGGDGDGGLTLSCDDDNGGCSPLVDCAMNGLRVECGDCPGGTEDINGNGTECRDVDECELDLDECDINPEATCINTMGSYRCRCPDGTNDSSTGGRNCIAGGGPVDECALEQDDCDDEPEATCQDEENGFTCTCPAGYEDTMTSGTNCVDIDECELGTDDCDADPEASCENTPGGFTCECPEGFQDPSGDGTDCQNIDDCAPANECDTEPNACVDGIDGYACVCPQGYNDTNGDGTVCDNIDECTTNTDLCDDAPVAMCTDTVGSYTCECPMGSTDPLLDGTVCTEPRTRVALGGRHACAIVDGGDVHCWGQNNRGQLGIGSISGSNEAIGDRSGETGTDLPVVDLGAPAVALAAGCAHTCAVLADGDVKCWGYNDSGQLGLGDTADRGVMPDQMGENLPAVPLNAPAVAITAGCNFSCALLEDGDVKCWGDNEYGQLGQGNKSDVGDGEGEVAALSPIALNGDVKAVRAGYRFVCAQLTTNDLKCWGRNQDGQLGLNDVAHRGDQANEMGAALPALVLGNNQKIRDFAAGYTHACAILDSDHVVCWGGEADGGTGYGDTTINRGDGITQMGETTMGNEMGTNLPPLNLPGNVMTLAAQRHTCLLMNDRSVACFGRNNTGELGIGSKEARGDQPDEMGAMLLKAPLGTGAEAVAVFNGPEEGANDANSCALLSDGRLKCWGANARGQLGLGDGVARGDDADELGDALPATIDLW